MDYDQFKELFSDVMPIISKAAPVIASYLGSPATGVILALLGAITNSDPCDHCSLADKLKNDPDLYAKLQQLDLTHADWVKKNQ
jgi:hypothetical protein